MKITIVILSVLLLLSNVFWLYQVIDVGITLSYKEQQIYELEQTERQLMVILPDIAADMSKEQVITVAREYTDQEIFEKAGCTWVGWLGFKFDENNRLSSVSPAWSYGEEDPCYPDS